MGLFDGVKNFMGGASMVKIEATQLERQAPDAVQFPLRDSVFKGQFMVTGEKDCVVLAHITELCLRTRSAEGGPMTGAFATSREDEKQEVTGRGYNFPYKLAKGQQQHGSFLIHSVDIPAAVSRVFPGVDPNITLQRPDVEVVVRITVDVKGSPFDPKIEIPVRILPG